MTIESTAFYPIFADPKQSSVVGKVGFAPVPAGPAGRWPANYTTGIAIASTVTDKKQLAAAKALLAFGTSKEMEEGGLAEESIANVARTSLLHSPLYDAKITKVSPDYAAAVAEDYRITSVNYRPLIPQWKAMGDSIGTAIEGAFTGQTPPAAALKNAAGEVTTLLKTQGVYGNSYAPKKGDAAFKPGGATKS
jgi:ABC-type glycerol-3-phosphate transport system substrate-binding protein